MQVWAYIPFLEPMNVFQTWWYVLMVPLALGISVTYKAMRIYDLGDFFRQVMVMTAQIVAAMVLLAAGLILLVQWVVPMLPAD